MTRGKGLAIQGAARTAGGVDWQTSHAVWHAGMRCATSRPACLSGGVVPPHLQAPMLMRPPSSADMAILKPSPSCPMRLRSGTRTPSNMTAVVGWAFHPSFASGLPKDSPSLPCREPGAGPRWRRGQCSGKAVCAKCNICQEAAKQRSQPALPA
jgi:hypothetical protein